MSRIDDVQAMVGWRVNLAPGATYRVTPIPGQLTLQLKLLAGGTLEIGGPGVAATFMNGGTFFLQGFNPVGNATYMVGSIGQTFGAFYPLGVGEPVAAAASGQFYLYASGATCTVSFLVGRSAGTNNFPGIAWE